MHPLFHHGWSQGPRYKLILLQILGRNRKRTPSRILRRLMCSVPWLVLLFLQLVTTFDHDQTNPLKVPKNNHYLFIDVDIITKKYITFKYLKPIPILTLPFIFVSPWVSNSNQMNSWIIWHFSFALIIRVFYIFDATIL